MYYSRSNINWEAIAKTTEVSSLVRDHLKSVYATLAVMIGIAAVGSYLHILFHIGGLLTIFCALGCSIALMGMPYNPNASQFDRLGLLFGFALMKGASIGPLLEHVLHFADDGQNVIFSAFAATAVVFACFSASALLAERRSYLYLAGFLSSGISTLFMISFFNMFFPFSFGLNVSLYLGLLVFCGFVIFDTQLIVEKASLGDRDYVRHSLELFIDFVAIFVRLLIILAKLNKGKKKRNNR